MNRVSQQAIPVSMVSRYYYSGGAPVIPPSAPPSSPQTPVQPVSSQPQAATPYTMAPLQMAPPGYYSLPVMNDRSSSNFQTSSYTSYHQRKDEETPKCEPSYGKKVWLSVIVVLILMILIIWVIWATILRGGHARPPLQPQGCADGDHSLCTRCSNCFACRRLCTCNQGDDDDGQSTIST
jgi:hypothetical protein